MLASISPLGERARGQRWLTTVASYVTASVVAGVALGAVAGELGQWLVVLDLRAGGAPVAAGVCSAAAVLDLVRVPIPGLRRQVNDNWLNTYRGWVYGAGYGFQLGGGLLTIVNTWAVYGMVVLALLCGSTSQAVVIGAVFGLARAAPVVALRRVREPDQLRGFHRQFQAVRLAVEWASIGVLGLLGAMLLAGIMW